jgi:hypothetical protein
MRVITRLAVTLVAVGALAGCGEPPSLVGTYSAQLTKQQLTADFPETSAPPGDWKLEFTPYEKVVVDAPDGGGFSLTIKTLKDDRVTFEATGCPAADGSTAGDPVYDIEREDGAISFTKVRDECVGKDPEARLLTVTSWQPDAAQDESGGEGSAY